MTMTKDQELYTRIGQTLFDAGPATAKKLFLTVTIPNKNYEDMDLSAFAVGEEGNESVIHFEADAIWSLSDAAIELHQYFASDLKSNWHRFNMELDADTGDMKADFAYD